MMKMPVSAGRYAVVGGGATLTHVCVAALLIETMGLAPEGANSVAFILANLVSYVANTRWSFESNLGLKTWGRFIIVSALAWATTIAIASSVDRAGGHYMLGIFLVVIVVPFVSFAAHRLFTYR